MFQIDGSDVDVSIGRVVDGVLVVFNTERMFSTSSANCMRCMSVNLNAYHFTSIYQKSKSQYIYRESCCHDMRA